jgi:hypothetical protein
MWKPKEEWNFLCRTTMARLPRPGGGYTHGQRVQMLFGGRGCSFDKVNHYRVKHSNSDQRTGSAHQTLLLDAGCQPALRVVEQATA